MVLALIWGVDAFGLDRSPYSQTTHIDGICTDTDGGKTFDLAGEVKSQYGKIVKDQCLTSSILLEIFCNPNTKDGIDKIQHYCQYGCSKGECKQKDKKFYPVDINSKWEPWQSGNKTVEVTLEKNIPKEICHDSDGGLNEKIRGVTYGAHGSIHKDTCISPSTLSEGYCEPTKGDKVMHKLIYCDNGCKNGECLEKKKETVVWTPVYIRKDDVKKEDEGKIIVETPLCQDSDGGLNEYERGLTQGIHGKTHQDTCVSQSTLSEGYCDARKAQNQVSHKLIYCVNGCVNGACRKNDVRYIDPNTEYEMQPWKDEAYEESVETKEDTVKTKKGCFESDDGVDAWNSGEATDKWGKSWEDFCQTPSTLLEYFCDKNGEKVGNIKIYCENGCLNGRCIQKGESLIDWSKTTYEEFRGVVPTTSVTTTTLEKPKNKISCVDTDGGVDINVKGDIYVSDKKVWGDNCLNPSTLIEGYCDRKRKGHMSHQIVKCPNGCYQGRCNYSG